MATSTAIVTGVDFVVVPTRDFDAAVEFYGTVLGLPLTARYGRKPGAEFETGTLTLAVLATEEFGMGFSVNRNPIAMHVEDYHAARAELESRGVVFTSDTIDSGVCHMASFEDPDGNTLMIHQRYTHAGAADRVTAAAGRRPRHYETAVHVTVTKTRTSPDEPIEVATIAGEEMLPWLRQIDGFEGLLMLDNRDDGTTLVISFWTSREVADEHRVARAEFRDKITSAVGVRVEEVTDYEIAFADLGNWAAKPMPL